MLRERLVLVILALAGGVRCFLLTFLLKHCAKIAEIKAELWFVQ